LAKAMIDHDMISNGSSQESLSKSNFNHRGSLIAA